MELLSILNDLEEFVQNSPRVPMTKKLLIDEEKILDFLDRARTILPEEVRKAKWLVQEREKVMSESRQEAHRLLEEAQKEVEKKVEESEVVRQAREMAEEIVRKAEQVSREMRLGARDYADNVMAKLDGRLEQIAKEIEAGRAELRNMK
ncbi:MAG: ATPase [Candidatus Desulforudis sp.]|nr:ATPase [Desulforudis sp.]